MLIDQRAMDAMSQVVRREIPTQNEEHEVLYFVGVSERVEIRRTR